MEMYHNVEKLKGFPKFYYLTLGSNVERQAFMTSQFLRYNIDGIPFITQRYVDMDPKPILNNYFNSIGDKAIGISISFINCLKNWYDNTDEEMAIFGEDDIDISSIEYWQFTWKQFVENLPDDWECIQLMRVLDPFEDKFWNKLTLQITYGRFWGSVGLMKRSWVKKILDRYLSLSSDGKTYVYNMHTADGEFCTAENILFFDHGIIYNVPLFHENNDVPASVSNKDYDYILASTGHRVCEMIVRDFWKSKGPTLKIKELLLPNVYKQKLAGFPTVYYPSLIESEDRREFMRQQFDRYKISHNPFLTKRISDMHPPPKIIGSVNSQFNNTVGVCIGHLNCLKNWYDNTDEEMAIFCEDDHDFSSVDHWPFTWKQFVENLPDDWECIQLVRICTPVDGFFDLSQHANLKNDFNLELKYGRWWGTAALMRRSWVKKILDRHVIGDNHYNLEVPEFESLIENILFLNLGVMYNFPLLTENNSFRSTVLWNDINLYIEGKLPHKICEKVFKNLWKNVDPETTIQDFAVEDFLRIRYDR